MFGRSPEEGLSDLTLLSNQSTQYFISVKIDYR